MLVAAIVGAGAPAAVSVLAVNKLLNIASPIKAGQPYHELVIVAASELFGMFLLLSAFLAGPALWRRTSDPERLRLLAFFYVQVVAVAVGVIAAGNVIAEELTAWLFGGLGTVMWWAWQHKWKGQGVAPSIFTGILKPAICPGQVWFATVPGYERTKARPVMVLGPGDDTKTWVCAYFTTQPPRSKKVASMYIKADADQIRGLSQTNWVQTRELKYLNRRAFRSYTGLAPHWLYSSACHGAGVDPDPTARVLEEGHAGDAPTPFEQSLLYTLGIKKREPDLELDASIIRPFLASLMRSER